MQDVQIVSDESMSQALFDYYNEILGSNFQHSRCINLQAIGLPVQPLENLEVVFSEEEVWGVVKELPNEKASGPDGFTGLFYKTT